MWDCVSDEGATAAIIIFIILVIIIIAALFCGNRVDYNRGIKKCKCKHSCGKQLPWLSAIMFIILIVAFVILAYIGEAFWGFILLLFLPAFWYERGCNCCEC